MKANRSVKTWIKTALYMDTVVELHAVTAQPKEVVEANFRKAFLAFRLVEDVCSRFTPLSELMRLRNQVGIPVHVSDVLFEAMRFAWTVAEFTEGAFDPTVGRLMEEHGFNKHYLTGERLVSHTDPGVSYEDVEIDEENRTVLLHKPLVIDLGAVAKGLAVDLAAKELTDFEGFVVNAGGDVYAKGLNDRGEPWLVGIQHPLRKTETLCTLHVSDAAVCTSGSYERPSPTRAGEHHLVDPRTGRSRTDWMSCTVVAPFAMMADAFSTAAFILGLEKGNELLEKTDLTGIWYSSTGEVVPTNRMSKYFS